MTPGVPATVWRAVQFDVPSAAVGRSFRVCVFVPWTEPPPAGYAVVFVLDGNIYFPIAASAAVLEAGRGSRPALVAGVGYATEDPIEGNRLRMRDLSPPTDPDTVFVPRGAPSARAEDFGGADAFLHFLVAELRPFLAARWPIDGSDQALYGHSLAGLFALRALFRMPGAFRSYAAVSPAISWNRASLLEDEAGFGERLRAGPTAPRVLIAAGGDEQDVPDHLPAGMSREDAVRVLAQARTIDYARHLASRLARADGPAGWQVRFHLFKDEDHLSVVSASISRALRFALSPNEAPRAAPRTPG